MYGSSLLPSKYLRIILPLLLLYSSLFLISQAAFNVAVGIAGNEIIEGKIWLQDLGFVYYSHYFAYIGVQCIPIFILATHLKFSAEYKEMNEKLEIEQKDLKQRLASSIAINADIIETGDLMKSDCGTECDDAIDGKHGKVKHKFSHLMKNGAAFLNYSTSLGWHIFLKNSYYITLVALLLCSLIEANLFNFGYLCFFVLFLLSRRIAMIGWVFLVLYTETVIMVTFLWQLSWTEGLDDTVAADWFGLQHYENLINGLFVSLLIFIFSIVQLGLIRVFEAQLKQEGKHLHKADVSSFTTDDLPLGPWTRIMFNSIDYFIDYSSLWICYLALYVVSMTGHFDLFSML